MHSEIEELQLPAFELDCRDWLIATPEDGDVPEEIGGAPVVAMLSTVLIESEDLLPGSVLLSVGLLDEPLDSTPASRRPGARLGQAARRTGPARSCTGGVAKLLDVDPDGGSARYVVAAPDGNLALLAEFSADRAEQELLDRFSRLMSSFRWSV